MEKLFKLKEHNTKVSTEIIAGLTTYFAMAYIIFVNPAMLTITGTPDNPFPAGAIFLATIFAAAAGTLVMALFANVPYAQAPGMGLNAFFTYTVCFGLGFTWQQALAMVFLCGVINIIITVTKLRKSIIKSIPESLQNAIGGGIGIFIAYIGIKKAGLLSFTADPGTYAVIPGDTVIADGNIVPGLVTMNTVSVILAVVSIILMAVLVIKKVPGAIFISIIVSTVLAVIFKVVDISQIGIETNVSKSFSELGTTFGAAFGEKGLMSLFSDSKKIPLVLMTIFAFSLSDTFDTIGTFIGTGRHTGIFSEEDQKTLETSSGFKSKMDKALFADAIATSVGAVFGTSNTTTYVESAAGIGAGGRTGLTALVTALMFLASIFLAPVLSVVPDLATAPALIIVGIMMLSSFADIKWTDLEEAVPAFFAGVFMALCYSISYGIAFGFIFYCIIKCLKGEAKQVHPILWVSTMLFILNFVLLALI